MTTTTEEDPMRDRIVTARINVYGADAPQLLAAGDAAARLLAGGGGTVRSVVLESVSSMSGDSTSWAAVAILTVVVPTEVPDREDD